MKKYNNLKSIFILLLVLILSFESSWASPTESDDKKSRLLNDITTIKIDDVSIIKEELGRKKDESLSKEEVQKIIDEHKYIFEYKGKKYDVKIAKFDLKDPNARVSIVMSEDKIGSVAKITDLAKPKKDDEIVLGAINGAFFNMRPDSQPASTILINGSIEHIENYGSMASFDGTNKLIIAKPHIKIIGSINGQWEAPYYWEGYNINHLYKRPFNAIMIFNDKYTGESPSGDMKCVVVNRNKVIEITNKFPEIDSNTYVLCAYEKYVLDNFKVGDTVEYRARYFERDGKKAADKVYKINDLKNAIGVGPTLVQDGKYAIEKGLEGHILSGYAKRSMVGMDFDKNLYMIVTSEMNFDTMAQLALKLKLKEAINLDGGGSSSLVVGGIPIKNTSRKLSNAIVVKKVNNKLIRVKLNDLELFFDVDPFIYNGRTMLPLRKILEKLGCDVKWNSSTGEIEVSRYNDKLAFKSNSKSVILNGKKYEMDVPILLKDGRSFISVRFLTEFLGGRVDWEASKRLVVLDLPTTNTHYVVAKALYMRKSYEYALFEFEKVLKLDENHVGSLKYTAKIYEEHLKDYRTAINYYEKVLKLLPEDFDNYNSLGELYLKLDRKSEAINLYNLWIEKDGKSLVARLGAARAYSDLDNENALIHYKWIKTNAKDVVILDEADKFIKKHNN